MKLLVGEKEVEFSEEQLDGMYLDEGREAEVFKYGDLALKIYKDYCLKHRLSESDAKGLIGIPTKRVLMPIDIIKNPETSEFMGYSTKYIHACSNEAIVNMQMEHFLDELEILEEDMQILADNNVDVDDLIMLNTLYDGNLYLCDPGSYVIKHSPKNGRILQQNIYELNHYVLNEVFRQVKVSKKKRDLYNRNYDESEHLSWQIRENTIPGETIKQHVKRMTK